MAVALSGAAAPVTGVRLAPELGGSVGRLRACAARGVASEPRVPVPRTAPAAPRPGPVFLPREQVWGYVGGLARRFQDLCWERGLCRRRSSAACSKTKAPDECHGVSVEKCSRL